VIKNEIRISHGLEPLPEDAELDAETLDESDTAAAADDTDETDDFEDPDVFLNEAANILTDLILPARTTTAATQ